MCSALSYYFTIPQENAKLLKEVEDDVTVDTDVATLPRTLDEAIPADQAARDSDQRAIVVTEMSGDFNMVGCNKAWSNLCGYAETEIIGKDSSILQNDQTNHLGLRDAVQRLFEEERAVKVVTTNKRKDGSRFRCHLTMAPLYNAQGKMTHCVAVLKNIDNVQTKGFRGTEFCV